MNEVVDMWKWLRLEQILDGCGLRRAARVDGDYDCGYSE